MLKFLHPLLFLNSIWKNTSMRKINITQDSCEYRSGTPDDRQRVDAMYS